MPTRRWQDKCRESSAEGLITNNMPKLGDNLDWNSQVSSMFWGWKVRQQECRRNATERQENKTVSCTERCRAVDGMVAGLWKPRGRESNMLCLLLLIRVDASPASFLTTFEILLGEYSLIEVRDSTPKFAWCASAHYANMSMSCYLRPSSRLIPRNSFIHFPSPFSSIQWKSICDSH